MSTRPLVLIGLPLVVVGCLSWYFYTRKPLPPHFHAGFQVYENDHLVDFSGDQFMHLEVCTTEPHALDNDPKGNVHLHDGIGDVAHVHRPGVVWGDLFNNLDFPLPASSAAYLNGQKADAFRTTLIKPYDSLVVFIGTNSAIDQKLAKAVSKAHIQAVEQIKESCGK